MRASLSLIGLMSDAQDMTGRTEVILKPTTTDEAIRLINQHEDAQFLAGGATLVAMMNADLVQPGLLISLDQIGDLKTSTRSPEGIVRIGAMRRHFETAADIALQDGQRIIADAASQIGNPSVRNMGTIGGAIGLADPAADYPPALVAVRAMIEIVSAEGRREIPAEDYFLGWYDTALEPNTLITAISVPPAPKGSVGTYHKLTQVTGDYAVVSVAAVIQLEKDICRYARVVVGSCGPRPLHLAEADAVLMGQPLSQQRLEEAGRMLGEAAQPLDDVRASARYRKRVIPKLVARTIAEAIGVRDHGGEAA